MEVYLLADELDVEVRELMDLLNTEYNMQVSSPKDSVNQEITAKVRERLGDESVVNRSDPSESSEEQTGAGGILAEEFEHLQEFRGFSVLQALGPDQLELMLEHSNRLTLEEEEILFEQETGPSGSFYVVIEGEIDILREVSGEQKSVNTMHTEDFFGEYGLFTGEPHLATAKAKGESEILEVTRTALNILEEEYPDSLGDLYQEMLVVMARRLNAYAQKAEKAEFWL